MVCTVYPKEKIHGVDCEHLIIWLYNCVFQSQKLINPQSSLKHTYIHAKIFKVDKKTKQNPCIASNLILINFSLISLQYKN